MQRKTSCEAKIKQKAQAQKGKSILETPAARCRQRGLTPSKEGANIYISTNKRGKRHVHLHAKEKRDIRCAPPAGPREEGPMHTDRPDKRNACRPASQKKNLLK
jgi:hypothetical protein